MTPEEYEQIRAKINSGEKATLIKIFWDELAHQTVEKILIRDFAKSSLDMHSLMYYRVYSEVIRDIGRLLDRIVKDSEKAKEKERGI